MKGLHIIIDLYDVKNQEVLERLDALERVLDMIAKSLELNVVGKTGFQFEPAGATAVLVLAESHFSAHTWYENKRVCVDLFTCNADALDAPLFLQLVQEAFMTGVVVCRKMRRLEAHSHA